MEAPEALPIECTTDKILKILGINTQGTRNGTQEDTSTESEGIGHLNDEDTDKIQAACRGYANRTLTNGIFVATRVQQKLLVSLMYWVKEQRQLGETTEIFNDVDEPTLRTMTKEANKRESHQKKRRRDDHR